MKISLRWLNEYLDPSTSPVTAEEAERVLTFAGFPIESAEKTEGGDVCLDVEVTSNRGDVLSHIGVAREIAASSGRDGGREGGLQRRLRLPAPNRVFDWGDEGAVPITPASIAGGSGGGDVGAACAIDNQIPDVCPLFTARVIRGVKVGPSPRWLVKALEAIGQRSINNVVDITNFVSAEYGQPTHVFDLRTLWGESGAPSPLSEGTKARVIVRLARAKETLKLLDGKVITLRGDEAVVADEGGGGGVSGSGGTGRAISLAGIMGGLDTQVTERTTDVLLEAATWDPLAVRRAARRFGIRTDASYRFERTVDARTIEVAAKRAAGLMVRLAGGRVLPGVIHAGKELKPLPTVRLRPGRCRAILGLDISGLGAPRMQEVLEAHDLVVRPEAPASGAGAGAGAGASGGGEPVLVCTIPAHRPDLEREIDLIEEVARTHGLEALPVGETIAVRVAEPQRQERAVREIAGVLTGLGFFEAITFTFVSSASAKPFVPEGHDLLRVSDERRTADPIVRPSAIPSLLACRKKNQDGGAARETGTLGGASGASGAGVRLFEISSVFSEKPSATKGERGAHLERTHLALLADACGAAGGGTSTKAIDLKQAGVRLMRGAIEAIASAMGGGSALVDIVPSVPAKTSAYDPGAFAEVRINGARAGWMGVISSKVQQQEGLDLPVVAAELEIEPLVALYPPTSSVRALPQFPSIERDVSLIVSESVEWARIDALVRASGAALLEAWSFVGTFRGKPIGEGKKSVTLRMRFRDPARTLRHDEVDPQVAAIVESAKRELRAEQRVA